MNSGNILASFLPELAAALCCGSAGERSAALRSLCREITPGVFAFRLFPASPPPRSEEPTAKRPAVDQQARLPERLLDEVSAVEAWAERSGWAVRRPNSMNRYGVVFADVGLGAVIDALVESVVGPMVAAIWPECEGSLGGRHAFTVRYRSGEDRRLDTHVDSSEVTLNVCLGGEFCGGGVYFHGRRGDGDDPMTSPHPAQCLLCRVSHQHDSGTALLHRGDHIHGAHNIESGVRTNLIVWCRRPARTLTP